MNENYERFLLFPKWKQDKIMSYAKEHDKLIIINKDWCPHPTRYYAKVREDWHYGIDGMYILSASFEPRHPKPKEQPKAVSLPPSNHKEWELCKFGYPQETGSAIKLRRDGGIYEICSSFMHNDHCSAILYTQEEGGITKYIHKVGFKQYNIRHEISKEMYDHIQKRIAEIKAEEEKAGRQFVLHRSQFL